MHSPDELKSLRFRTLSKREFFGPRGTLTKPAEVESNLPLPLEVLIEEFRNTDNIARDEIVLCLGEWGGEKEIRILIAEFLRSRDLPDEKTGLSKTGLISALTNIGGPMAVNILFQISETENPLLSRTALANLESLVTNGASAITEKLEPATIMTPEEKMAFTHVENHLIKLINMVKRPISIVIRAKQVLELVQSGLKTTHV